MLYRDSLRNLLVEAFSDYEKWLSTSTWRGKEHDCVNLFVHRFLFPRISPEGPIFDPTQIGIETGIPQGIGLGKKQAVRNETKPNKALHRTSHKVRRINPL